MPYIGQGLEQGRRQLHTFTATASQTTFSVSYSPGFVDVYQNGILLAPSDFTATNGTTVVLAVGAAVNDEITIIAQHLFSVADSVSASQGGTFTGDVTMAGNLTVQGTTITVDTSTAQTLAMGDADKIILGDDNDLQIFHNNGNNRIQAENGPLFLQSNDTASGVSITGKNASETMAKFIRDGAVELYHNDVKKFETSSTDTIFHGTGAEGIRLNVTGQTYHHKIRSNGDGLLLSADDDDTGGAGADIRFNVANDEKMRLNHDGNLGIGMIPDSAVKLSISGSIGTTNGTDAAPTHTFYSDSDTGMYRVGANTLGFVTGATDALTIDSSQHATFNADIIAKKHLRLYTTDDQANQWYVYNHVDDTLRFNYNGSGSDEAIFHTNGNIDFATNQTTSVRINSNARTNTGLNVGGASSTATGIYVDNSDGSATLDIAVLGSSYGSHGASAGEVWFYSPDNINIGGATGSSNTINLLGGGRKNVEFRNNGVVFYPEVGNQGDMTFPICSVSNNGSGGQYMHVQFQAQGGDMLHIHFLGYDYSGRYRSGGAGGYIYNTAGQASLYASAVSGNCVTVYQNIQNRVELVIDTGAGGTGNRWGSYLFFGGTDTITGNSRLTLTQYAWNGSTGRLY